MTIIKTVIDLVIFLYTCKGGKQDFLFIFSLVIIYKLLNSGIYRCMHKDYIEKILFLKLKTLEAAGSIIDSIIHLIIQYLHQKNLKYLSC